MVKKILAMFCFLGFFAGCSAPSDSIPDIPQNHPAQKFYKSAQTGMLSDKVCKDLNGRVDISASAINEGDKFLKAKDILPGVFLFSPKDSNRKYLGVSFMQYSGFIQIPKVCYWEN